MSCLVHDSKFASIFHSVLNETRKKQKVPNFPKELCSCRAAQNLSNEENRIEAQEDFRYDSEKLQRLKVQVEKFTSEENPIRRSFRNFRVFLDENFEEKVETTEEIAQQYAFFAFLRWNKYSRRTNSRKLRWKIISDFSQKKPDLVSIAKKNYVFIGLLDKKTRSNVQNQLKNVEPNFVHPEAPKTDRDEGVWLFVQPKNQSIPVDEPNIVKLTGELIERWKELTEDDEKLQSKCCSLSDQI